MSLLPPEVDTPGLMEALLAVREIVRTASPQAPVHMADAVITALGAARAHVQAETAADLSDYMLEAGQPVAAELLDMISYELRRKADTR